MVRDRRKKNRIKTHYMTIYNINNNKINKLQPLHIYMEEPITLKGSPVQSQTRANMKPNKFYTLLTCYYLI